VGWNGGKGLEGGGREAEDEGEGKGSWRIEITEGTCPEQEDILVNQKRASKEEEMSGYCFNIIINLIN